MVAEINTAIIGAGFAGLTAALNLAFKGEKVTVFEQFPIAGKKVLATGGGRCNITNTLSAKEFISRFHQGNSFISHAIKKHPPSKLVSFFNKNGLKTICTDGFHIFPSSQKSHDVVNLLFTMCKNENVSFTFNTTVSSIDYKEDVFIVHYKKKSALFNKLVITSGGVSWPNLYSTTIYNSVESLGHIIEPCYPGLCEIECLMDGLENLAGTVIKKASVSINDYTSTGELLITHKGVSGPSAINCASLVAKSLNTPFKTDIFIDFLPDITAGDLESDFVTLSQEKGCKTISGWLSGYLTKKLSKTIIEKLNIDSLLHLSKISSVSRKLLIKSIKQFCLVPVKTAGFKKAMVTKGGVSTNDINPKTMESKLIKKLYFAGEVIDIDGPCGGFNLQWAYSSAMSVA